MKGSRDRSSGRTAAVASTPGSRAQSPVDGGFLGLHHKTKLADGSSRRQVVEAWASVSGLTEATGVDGVYGLAAGEEVTGVGHRLGPSEVRGGKRRLGPRCGGGNLPVRGVLAVFSKPATYPGFTDPPKPHTGASSTWRHRGEDFDSKKEPRPSDKSLYLFLVLPLRAF